MELREAFTAQMRDLLGDEAEAFFAALSSPSPVSVRQNPRKESRLPAGVTAQVAWCPWGRYLSERPSFTADPLFHAGCYYVQEASSMFLWQAVAAAVKVLGDRPLTVLDLCAAPGGKSTLLCDALPEGSLLVANEIIRQRANVLAENLTKWGYPRLIVTSADPSAPGRLKETFDLILTDVPCSGEGMFRKEEDALTDWGLGAVAMCADRQRLILRRIWPALKPGGCLIYSTCTYNLQENEENVAWICRELGAQALPLPFENEAIHPGFSLPAARFFPHRLAGEGLFMALLQKTPAEDVAAVDASPFASSPAVMSSKRAAGKGGTDKRSSAKCPPPVAEALFWLQASDQASGQTAASDQASGQSAAAPAASDFVPVEHNGTWSAVPRPLMPLLEALQKNKVPVLLAGVTLGCLKGKDFIPDTALALSTALPAASASPAASSLSAASSLPAASASSVSSVELSREEALAYLRREALVLPPSVPKGYVRVCYEGHPLGWVKNLGPRANNLYPAEWRIRNLKP